MALSISRDFGTWVFLESVTVVHTWCIYEETMGMQNHTVQILQEEICDIARNGSLFYR